MATERWVLVEQGTLETGERVALDRLESQHLAVTLRLRPGDTVTLCDGRGGVADAALEIVDARRCEARIVARHEPLAVPPPRVVVGLGVLHGQAMDWAVQKCVETGVAGLVPLLVERSQLGARAAAARAEHWRRVARQALKQCRRPWQMEVAEPQALERLVAERAGAAGLVADPAGDPVAALPGPLPDLLVVGPEGGFAPGERQLLREASWPEVRLGRWVLRAETAAVVGAAMLIAEHEARAAAGDAPGQPGGFGNGNGSGSGGS
ncbi:MAG TPA: RsmE family RNA methyltransferase [Thermoanaerobaculales bacterium]|nr:RsmE family RNA methyltransferase [Thermoanaerobaculales bacterium]HPA81167.1 RsmE family RNA methyltransferase [Thermoanaerobaculales bacterium]HQL28919.1 RsmE family RNA methyltransferase [Thermoanaerobaculales bacterium]HQN96411.1 RsmE family RNA methyltransferase [Thermoanaerobaculales bacterium]HQP44426.1 RsmE family RNA methyltransferase [Thermoanaerobaculales bacterium]